MNQSPQLPFRRTAPELSRLPPLSRSDRPRLIKDVLRVGTWFVGEDESGKPQTITVTEADLEAFVSRFAEHQAAGITHPLCWNHTPRGIQYSDVDAKDVIATIEQCWAEGGTLWIGVYPSEADAAKLTDQERPVSIGRLPNWRDGTGKLWSGWSLMHVGIVPHAVIPNQYSFLEMAASTRPKGKRMTFDVVKEVLNKLLEAVKPGTSLPEAATEENFDEMVPALIGIIVGDAPAEEESEVPEDVAEVPVLDGSESLEMSAFMASVNQRFDLLMTAITGKQTADAETAFRERATAMGTAGVPAAAIAQALELGAKMKWDNSILDFAAKAAGKGLELGSATKGQRQATPDKTGTLTPEAIAEAKAFMARKQPAKK